MRQIIRNLSQRCALMLGRAIVSAINDGTKLQTLNLSLLAGENRAEIERLQNYGLSTVPPAGSEAAVLFIGGNREHGIAVAVDNRDARPTGGAPGDVTIYDIHGNKIKLTATGIELIPKAGQWITINGNTRTYGLLTNNDVNIGSTHVHGGGSPPS